MGHVVGVCGWLSLLFLFPVDLNYLEWFASVWGLKVSLRLENKVGLKSNSPLVTVYIGTMTEWTVNKRK